MLKIDAIRGCGAQTVRLAECNIGGEMSEMLLNSLGLYVLDQIDVALCNRIREVQLSDAIQIVARMLHQDLAYSHPGRASRQECEDFALSWFSQHEAEGTKYYTNGDWLGFWTHGRGDWLPLTRATFDGGVIAVGAESSACIWFEAED